MSDLVKVTYDQNALVKGGIGTTSKLFELKPANIQLVQKMTRAEGAIPGKVRVRETGDQFDFMHLVLLFEPVQRRRYFEGDEFGPDNLLCFSSDCVAPHPSAKVPQALECSKCPKASWERWRETKAVKDLPPCKKFWHTLVIDRVTQMPYYMDVFTKSIKPFEASMQNMARQMALLKSQGKNPNIFDFSFKVRSVLTENKVTYRYDFYDVAPVADSERDKFGAIFLDFVNRYSKPEEIETDYVDADLVEDVKTASQPTEVTNDNGEIII